MKKFSGNIISLLRSGEYPSSFVSTAIKPEFVLSIDYGERGLGRIANLALLVLKSAINSHFTYPRFIPILFRPTAAVKEDNWKTIPFSLFNDSFLQLSELSLSLPSISNDDVTVVYSQLTFNGQKIRTDAIAPTEVVKKKAKYSFPLNCAISDLENEIQLNIKICGKRKKLGGSTILDEISLPIKVAEAGKLIHVKLSLDPLLGGFIEFEYVLLVGNLLSYRLPEDWNNHLSYYSEQPNKYMDGLNWSNLKIALETFAASTKPSGSAISLVESPDNFSPEPNRKILELRNYETKIVEILKFLADHELELSDGELIENPFSTIQSSLEVFHAEVLRLMKHDSETSLEEIYALIQSFVQSLSRKLNAIEETHKDIVEPIESHLRSMLSVSLGSVTSNSDAHESDLLKSPIYDKQNLSVPNLSSDLFENELVPAREFTCYLGPLSVSLLIIEDSLVIDNVYQQSTDDLECSLLFMSLHEYYGKDLSLQVIQSHQFTKRWNLSINSGRLTIGLSHHPLYFPTVSISLEKVLRLRLYDDPNDRGYEGNFPLAASFIELEYLQDEETKSIEYLKFYAEKDVCEKLYDILQCNFLFHGNMQSEIPWTSIERTEICGKQLHLYFNTIVGHMKTVECLRFSSFHGQNDIGSAYCEFCSKIYLAKHPHILKNLSSTLSLANSSTSSLFSSASSQGQSNGKKNGKFSLFQLSRIFHRPEYGFSLSDALYNNFGIAAAKSTVCEFSCSFFRRGLSVGRLFISPNYLCFSGKRNGVKTSKVDILDISVFAKLLNR
jgi:hypothetical protein